MNKEWSELNKTMQTQIRKNDTYEAGIDTLFELRNRLMKILTVFYSELNREEFNAIPFLNADGYHSKTIAYSIWHIFRIEDIVAHNLDKRRRTGVLHRGLSGENQFTHNNNRQ